MHVTLRFNLHQVLDLAEQAITAAGAEPAVTGVQGPPALHWVTGDGTYLTADTRHQHRRVYALGYGPGGPCLEPVLAGIESAGVQTLPLGEPADQPLIGLLRAAAADGHTDLLLHPGPGRFALAVARPVPHRRPGKASARAPKAGTDAAMAWLAAATGDEITDRPWQADFDDACPALAELASLCQEVADTLAEETAAVAACLADLQHLATTAAADLPGGAATSRPVIAGRALAQHAALARHEVLRNLLTHLYAAWRNTRTHHPAGRRQAPAGDQQE